ncbi:MAG: YcxB family protein [Candidatus Angelobacter sp.]
MQFNYEIPSDEFVAAQIALHTAKNKRRLIKRALGYTVLGVVFGLIALFRYPDLGPLLLLLVAANYICVGITNLFPQRYFRKGYLQSGLEGKSYQAELDESGFLVNGDSCSWRVAWSEVHLKGENKRVFIFYAKGTVFIFGKKYLTDEQQRDIRRFI